MDKRNLKSIGKDISLLGFGCMRLPIKNDNTEDIDFQTGQEMVDTAIHAGVNYFDTAWGYHGGKSELFIGEALKKYNRDSFYLATKMPTWDILESIETAEDIFNKQLERCQVEYFDFYLAHNVTADTYPRVQNFKLYDFLHKKREQGFIRHLGFSFHDNCELFEKVLNDYEWEFSQIQLNYIDWTVTNAKRQYELITKKGIPVIVMEPVRGGSLASLNQEALDIFKSADLKRSPASWALRFAASLPNVMTVLSGMSTTDQVIDNINTFSNFTSLTDYEHQVILKAATSYNSSRFIPCTACCYCMKCPFGINIPRAFSIFNLYKSTGNRISFRNNNRTLTESEKAHNCTGCGACLSKCPQKIDIPKNMKEIADFTDTLFS